MCRRNALYIPWPAHAHGQKLEPCMFALKHFLPYAYMRLVTCRSVTPSAHTFAALATVMDPHVESIWWHIFTTDTQHHKQRGPDSVHHSTPV
jgi:hypothetical protein